MTEENVTLDDAMERADRISELVRELRGDLSMSETFEERLTDTKKYGRTNRVAIVLMAVSLLFDLAITGYLYTANRQIDRNTQRVAAAFAVNSSTKAQLARDNRARCENGNDFRRADRARWDYIVRLSPAPTTPEAQDRLDRFRAFISEADALRVC